jgi:MGT family glycosyltransferase
MHALFTPLGSHGDVHPSIAIALELARRGHRCTIATNPHFQSLIEGVGLGFAPLGEKQALRDAAQTPGVMREYSATTHLIRKLLLPQLPRAIADFDATLRTLKPDVAVLHPLALGAPQVCAKHGVRTVTTALAPIAWMNPDDTPVFLPNQPVTPPRWQSRFQVWAGTWLMRLHLDRGVNRCLREAGLPTGRDHMKFLCAGGSLNLGLWSEHFRPALASDAPTQRIVGFPWFDRVREEEDNLDSLLSFVEQGGEAPLVFTLGTAGVHVAGSFYEVATRVCDRLRRKGVLLVNQRDYAPKASSPLVRSFTYAPYSMLFPKAAAVITSGGIGSTAQALRSGRPALIIPFAHDQFDNAARVARLGVGTRLRHTKVNEDRLHQRLQQLLTDASFAKAAAALGPKIAASDGARGAADAIERAMTSQAW